MSRLETAGIPSEVRPKFSPEFLKQFNLGDLTQLPLALFNFDPKYFALPDTTDVKREEAYEEYSSAINQKLSAFDVAPQNDEASEEAATKIVALFKEKFCEIFTNLDGLRYVNAANYFDDASYNLQNYIKLNYKRADERKNLCNLLITIIAAAFYFTRSEEGIVEPEKFDSALSNIQNLLNLACVGGNITSLNEAIQEYRFPRFLYHEVKKDLIRQTKANIYVGNQVHLLSLIDRASGSKDPKSHEDNNLFTAASDMTMQDSAKLFQRFNLRGFQTILNFFANKYEEFSAKVREEIPEITEENRYEFSGKILEEAAKFGIERVLFAEIEDEIFAIETSPQKPQLIRETIADYFLKNPKNNMVEINDQDTLNKLHLINIVAAFAIRNIPLPIWLTAEINGLYNQNQEHYRNIMLLVSELEHKGIISGANQQFLSKFPPISYQHMNANADFQNLLNAGNGFRQIAFYINHHLQNQQATGQPLPWQRFLVTGSQPDVKLDLNGLLFNPSREAIMGRFSQLGFLACDFPSVVRRAMILGEEHMLSETNMAMMISQQHPLFIPPKIFLPQLRVIFQTLGDSTIAKKLLLARHVENHRGASMPLLSFIFQNDSNQVEILNWLKENFNTADFIEIIINTLLTINETIFGKYQKAFAEILNEDEIEQLVKTLKTSQLSTRTLFNAAEILFVKKDYKNAVKLYQTMSDRGDSLGTHNLILYHNGEFDKKNFNPKKLYEVCKKYFEQAGDNYDEENKLRLANACEFLSISIPKKYSEYQEEAFVIYDSLHKQHLRNKVTKKASLARARFYEKTFDGENYDFENALAIYESLSQDEDLEIRNSARFQIARYQQYGFVSQKPDLQKAFEAYKELEESEPKNFEAIAQLIICYIKAIGTEENPQEAFRLCQEYAEDSYEIQALLFDCYAYGIGTAADEEEAREIYRNANYNNTYISCKFAKFLDEEKLDEIDDVYSSAFKHGSKEASYHVATRYDAEGNPRKMLDLLEVLEQEAYLPAIMELGEFYGNNSARNHNLQRSIRYYEKACCLGSEIAMLRLARIYNQKEEVKNDQQSEKYYRLFLDYNRILQDDFIKEAQDKISAFNSRKRHSEDADSAGVSTQAASAQSLDGNGKRNKREDRN